MNSTATVRAPWYHWAIALIGILWNGFGAMDYSMTQLQGDVWLQNMGMTEPQIAYLNAMPGWAMGVWAAGVWGGVIGGLMLLFRKRLAVTFFAISLVAYLVSLVYTYVLSNGNAVIGGQSTYIMQAVILAGCLFFLWYARRAAANGILR